MFGCRKSQYEGLRLQSRDIDSMISGPLNRRSKVYTMSPVRRLQSYFGRERLKQLCLPVDLCLNTSHVRAVCESDVGIACIGFLQSVAAAEGLPITLDLYSRSGCC